MLTANEVLLDAAIEHSIDTLRYSNGVVRRLIALLNRSDNDLNEQIIAALQRLPAESFTVERLDMLLADVRRINEAAYQQLRTGLEGELKELVSYEAGYQAQLFQSVLPVQVSVAAVSVEQVYSAALARPMQSRLLKEWAAGIEADKMTRIRDALRMGYVEGQTIQQMVQRIRGTKARGYEDGIIQVDRRNAEAVVRTAIAHTANHTRQRFYESNSSLIKSLKWVSAIDGRTSAVCRARDGQTFPLNSGPRPPAHWGCRSSMTPVLVTWRDLNIDMDEISPSTRASLDGQIPEDTTYSQWIKGKSATYQDEVLGKTQGKLFRDGGLTLDKFIDKTGKEYSLSQLREKNAAAFSRAGL